MKPIGSVVIIKPIVEEIKSGLYITGAQTTAEKNHLNHGKVVSVGSEVKQVKPGHEVYYIEGTYWKNDKRVNQDEFEENGEKFIAIKEKEIKLIIEE